MKKRIIIAIMIMGCILLTGCETKKQIKQNKDGIKQYIKTTISGNWTFAEEKLSIDDDYTTTITLYNVEDWITCANSSKQFTKLLKDNLKTDIKLKKIYFSCKASSNDEVNSYIEIKDITTIKMDNFNEEIIPLDNMKNKITESYDEALIKFKNEYVSKCESYNYKEIFRHSEKYVGKYAKFTGEVIQVLESNGYYSLRINVTNNDGWYEDTIFVSLPTYSSEGRILEDDIITVYGKLGNLYEYESIFGEPITIPYLSAEYVDIS